MTVPLSRFDETTSRRHTGACATCPPARRPAPVHLQPFHPDCAHPSSRSPPAQRWHVRLAAEQGFELVAELILAVLTGALLTRLQCWRDIGFRTLTRRREIRLYWVPVLPALPAAVSGLVGIYLGRLGDGTSGSSPVRQARRMLFICRQSAWWSSVLSPTACRSKRCSWAREFLRSS